MEPKPISSFINERLDDMLAMVYGEKTDRSVIGKNNSWRELYENASIALNKPLLPEVARANRRKHKKITAVEPTSTEKAAMKQLAPKDKQFLADMLQDMQRDLQRGNNASDTSTLANGTVTSTSQSRHVSLPVSEVDMDDTHSLLSQESYTSSVEGSLTGSVTSMMSAESLGSLASVDAIGVRGRLLARLPKKYGMIKKAPKEDYAAPVPGQQVDMSKLQKLLLRIGEAFARFEKKLDYDLSGRDDDPVSATELRERLRSDLQIETNTSDVLLLFSKFDTAKLLVVDYCVILSNARSIFANYSKKKATDDQIQRLQAVQTRLKDERALKAEKRKRLKEKRLQKMRENGQAGGAAKSVLTEKAIAEAASKLERDRQREQEQREYLSSVINPSRRDIEAVTEKLAIASYYYRAYHEQPNKTVVRSNYENVDVLLNNYALNGVSKISKSDFHNLLNYGLLFNVREFGDEHGQDVEPFTSKQLQIVDQRYRFDDAYSNAADGSNFRPIPTEVLGPDGEPEAGGVSGRGGRGRSDAQGQAQTSNPFLFSINVDAFMKEFHALGSAYAQRLRKNDNIQSFLKAVSCPPTANAGEPAGELGDVAPAQSADPNRVEAALARHAPAADNGKTGDDDTDGGSVTGSAAGGSAASRSSKRSAGGKKAAAAPPAAPLGDEMAESFIAMFRETVTAEINKSISGLQADGKPKRALRGAATSEDRASRGGAAGKSSAGLKVQPVPKSRQRPQDLRRSAAETRSAGSKGSGSSGAGAGSVSKLEVRKTPAAAPPVNATNPQDTSSASGGSKRSTGKPALRSPGDKPADSRLTNSEAVGDIAGDLVRRKEASSANKTRTVSFSGVPDQDDAGSSLDDEHIPDYSPSPPGTAPTAKETLSALLDGMSEPLPQRDIADDDEVEELLDGVDL